MFYSHTQVIRTLWPFGYGTMACRAMAACAVSCRSITHLEYGAGAFESKEYECDVRAGLRYVDLPCMSFQEYESGQDVVPEQTIEAGLDGRQFRTAFVRLKMNFTIEFSPSVA